MEVTYGEAVSTEKLGPTPFEKTDISAVVDNTPRIRVSS